MVSFPPRFLDELRSRLPVSVVVGKSVKLTKKGREFTGLCPFHHEKTPSFTVNDDKGFYHCFGCGAHGDIITYAIEHDKLPFPEAVEYLASLAGLSIPKPIKAQSENEAHYHTYLKIMESATRFFQHNLFAPAAQEARKYFAGRGITPEIAKQFRLGYAPRSFEALVNHLKKENLPLTDALSLGVLTRSKTHDNSLRDYFYHRIMFPISDKRGRIIAFGGRLLEKGEPKYLNSPETPLFHKGEQLFALAQALPEIRKKNTAILVEGYMDVISLHSAGFKNAVAPLGTALTEKQLQILWPLCDAPLICFDGDAAGQKAAFRALERAIPLLTEGKSLRFVWLPDGLDPDDIIRKKSPQAFQNLIDAPDELIDVLWRYLHTLFPTNTPEQKAKFELEMNAYCQKITNKTVRTYYQRALKNKLWQFLHAPQKGKITFKQALPPPTVGFESIKNLLCYFIFCPDQAEKFTESLSCLQLQNNELKQVVNAILELYCAPTSLSAEFILTNLPPKTADMFRKFQKEFLAKQDDPLLITKEMTQIFNQLHLQKLQEQINTVMKMYCENPTEQIKETLNALQAEKEKLTKQELFS